MLNFAWFVAHRFRHSKRKSGFANFMSSSSTVGIALGCAVLIMMLSVMNGFETELKEQLLSKIPHGEIKAISSQGLLDWQYRLNQFENDASVKLAQPFAKLTGLAQRGKFNKAVEMTALNPLFAAKTELKHLVSDSGWQRFVDDQKAIILGKGIADKLQVKIGDKIQLLIPPISQGRHLERPIVAWGHLVDVIELGGEFDNFTGYMRLSNAVDILNIASGAQGIQLTYHDPFVAPTKTREFAYQLQQAAYLSDWTRTQGHLYQDIQLVRMVVYIALMLVIAVACFNIVSSLVMLINEKKPEIDMLLTMGATQNDIVRIFIIQGLTNAIKGTMIGTILGVLGALYLTEIITGLESLFSFQVLSGDVYFIDYLPSELHALDIAVTAGIALVISVIAVLYSSLKFARQPISLR